MARFVLISACLLLLAVAATRSQTPSRAPADDALRAALTADAERVVLPERCGECHAAEFEVWEATPHATGFDTLHGRDRAKEIYRSLGLRVIKRGTDEATPACLSCHYTPVLRRNQLRAGAGVTCESCHGPARDWISIHNSYGVAEADFQQAALLETSGHRMQRIADSRAAGMRRPSDLYGVAANCFECHTVPNEDLVNRGGHSTGSDFEIVAWSERIRHNFLKSYKTADGRTNAARPREWKRRMYVIGRALGLEYAVRGAAVATKNDELYLLAMSDRAFGAFDELVEINDRVALPAVQRIIALWNAVDIFSDDGDRLRAAADAMRDSMKKFVADADGAAWVALDPLWNPAAEETEPPVRLTEIPDAPVFLPSAPEGEDLRVGAAEAARDGGERLPPSAVAPGRPPTGVASVRDIAVSVPDIAARLDIAAAPGAVLQPAPPLGAPARIVTLLRPPWREPSSHAFVKVPCGRCHNSQERWWRGDPHSSAAKPFRSNESRNVEIAVAYGVATADMARGNQVCMWCHGTPVSAPARKLRTGVGCQRCHGAGADYLEPHETVGYADTMALGMTDLRNPAVQAATCAGCHYITDPGLIDAGHPTGDEFDMRVRIDDIEHWGAAFGRSTQPVDRASLMAAYASVVAERGPAPTRRAAAADVALAPPVAVPVSDAGEPQQPNTRADTPRPALAAPAGVRVTAPSRPAAAAALTVVRSTAVPSGRPPRSGAFPKSPRSTVSRVAQVSVADPGLEAFRPDADASVEETLFALRARIELLYRELRGRSG